MKYLFCGGGFCFDYLEEDYETKAAEDYRAMLLKDTRKLLRGRGTIPLGEDLSYVGPFYFESDGMADREIVGAEAEQIGRCTHAFFLLDGAACPGTVAEMVYAASLGKYVSTFYIRDDRETESMLRSPCWYPMILCGLIAGDRTELIPCRDPEHARRQILLKAEALAGQDEG